MSKTAGDLCTFAYLGTTRGFMAHRCKCNALVIGLPGKGDPGTTGGNQLKLKKSAPQYPGLSGLLGLFLARGLGTFSGVSGWLPLSHCLSDLHRVETLLSDHARRLGDLITCNVKSCDSSRYPPSRESR